MKELDAIVKDLDELARKLQSHVKPKLVGYGLTVLNKTIHGLEDLKKAVERMEREKKDE